MKYNQLSKLNKSYHLGCFSNRTKDQGVDHRTNLNSVHTIVTTHNSNWKCNRCKNFNNSNRCNYCYNNRKCNIQTHHQWWVKISINRYWSIRFRCNYSFKSSCVFKSKLISIQVVNNTTRFRLKFKCTSNSYIN